MTSYKLKLRMPEHGWVPVTLNYGEEIIEFAGSDVPNNPIQDLIDGLWRILRGDITEIWWHLEPGGYFFHYERKSNKIEFKLFFEENTGKSNRIEVACIEDTNENILLPIWRAIKEFSSYKINENNWPETDFSGIDEIGEKIKNV